MMSSTWSDHYHRPDSPWYYVITRLCKVTMRLLLYSHHCITYTDECSLVAGETHPADDGRPGRSDASLAIVDTVNVPSVQTFQVRSERRYQYRNKYRVQK